MVCRESKVKSGIEAQAVTIQRRTSDGVVSTARDKSLAGFGRGLAVEMFPAGAETRCQLHAVIQRVEFCQAQAECAAEVVLQLVMDFKRCGTPFFRVAIALITLIAKTCEWLDIDVGAAEVVPDFSKRLLGAGVVPAFGAVLETIEGHLTLGTAVVIAVAGAKTQGNETTLAQGISP